MYLSEADRHEGQALYLVILDRLRRDGATGASALRGMAGFGPGQRVRFGTVGVEQQPPVIIEWIDRSERIARILPQIAELLPDALITLEDIQVYRAILRGRGPLTEDMTIGDLMVPARTVLRSDSARVALAHIVAGQRTVPIVNDDGSLCGTITSQDLAWRADMHVPAAVLSLLSAEEATALLAKLDNLGIEQVMNREPRSVMRSAALTQALITMTEWGLGEVPVIERNGQVVGQIVDTALLELATRPRDNDEQVRDAEPTILGAGLCRLVCPMWPPTSRSP
ncbi:CBS domain-containing protein [Candidatus Gracilibacteria bacterium]|nr:CBS domain-containing protein [Candidatus Gracilibacteria bacterium]